MGEERDSGNVMSASYGSEEGTGAYHILSFPKAMANATNRAESFLEWIQGMIMRYESGRIPSTKFIQEVIERTVSTQHPLLGIGKFFVLR